MRRHLPPPAPDAGDGELHRRGGVGQNEAGRHPDQHRPGRLIDENALLDALEAGRLCGAGIDAFSSEPPKDPRWFTLDNVVLGSHCAASTAGASRNMGRMATANLIHDLGL